MFDPDLVVSTVAAKNASACELRRQEPVSLGWTPAISRFIGAGVKLFCFLPSRLLVGFVTLHQVIQIFVAQSSTE